MIGRMLSAFLALVMCIATLPAPAFAAGADDGSNVSNENISSGIIGDDVFVRQEGGM